MADFNEAYRRTSSNEGGYANVSGDTGGETYAGIARNYWKNWAGWSIVDANKPLRHNQKIKNETLSKMVSDFYKKEFWDKIMGDKIASQMFANRLYDSAVNFGTSRAIKQAQRSVSYKKEDGLMTLDLINEINKVIYE